MSAESEATGYAAVIGAAAAIATSSIVSRASRDEAEKYCMDEIDRWTDGRVLDFDIDPDEKPDEKDPDDQLPLPAMESGPVD